MQYVSVDHVRCVARHWFVGMSSLPNPRYHHHLCVRARARAISYFIWMVSLLQEVSTSHWWCYKLCCQTFWVCLYVGLTNASSLPCVCMYDMAHARGRWYVCVGRYCGLCRAVLRVLSGGIAGCVARTDEVSASKPERTTFGIVCVVACMVCFMSALQEVSVGQSDVMGCC